MCLEAGVVPAPSLLTKIVWVGRLVMGPPRGSKKLIVEITTNPWSFTKGVMQVSKGQVPITVRPHQVLQLRTEGPFQSRYVRQHQELQFTQIKHILPPTEQRRITQR